MKKISNEDLQEIESCFSTLKNDGIGNGDMVKLKKILDKVFHKNFSVKIILTKDRKYSFVMAVIPEKSLIEKITTAIANEKGTSKVISDLWRKCNSWLIEIDERIICSSFSERELTALLLHEIGHVVESDSVPKRLTDVVQYGIVSSNFSTKSVVKKNIFNKILSIPLVNACLYGNSKTSLKKEMKADQYAVKNGYLDPLLSAMNKIEQKSIGSNNLEKSMNFSLTSLEALRQRKGRLMKESFDRVIEALPDNYLKETVCEIENDIIETFSKGTMTEEGMYESVANCMEDLCEEGYMREFLEFGKKKMKPILQNEIDYVEAKSQSIESVDDKIMLISYINSKLDMIAYYTDILNHPKLRKKYIIPNTESQLVRFNNQLIHLKKFIMNYKIPEQRDELVSWYPKGYEG